MDPRERLIKLRRLKELRSRGVQTSAPEVEASGTIVPISRDTEGNVSFDSDAGILGFAKRVATLPGDVLSGEVDPKSKEGFDRTLEMALAISPLSAASRASPKGFPGARVKKPRPKIPTTGELKDAASFGYKKAESAGVEFVGSGIKNFADDVASGLDKEGFIAALSPKTRALLEKLQSPPEGSVASLRSIDAFRKQIGRVAGSPDKTEAAAANIVLGRVDRFLENINPADVVARPAASTSRSVATRGSQSEAANIAEQAAQVLSEARGNSAAGFRSDRITGVGNAAELRAAAANSGQNIGNTIRQRLASLILSRKDSRGFSPEELAGLKQIVEGTASTNTLRRLSNMLGGGGGLGQTMVLGASGATGAAVGGVPGAAVGAAVPALLGSGARGLANKLTKGQLRAADEAVRMRSPLFQQLLKKTPSTTALPDAQAALVRGLLAPRQSDDTRQLIEFLRAGGA